MRDLKIASVERLLQGKSRLEAGACGAREVERDDALVQATPDFLYRSPTTSPFSCSTYHLNEPKS